MKATPLIAGRAYRVTWRGQSITVVADHPCTAIINAIEVFTNV